MSVKRKILLDTFYIKSGGGLLYRNKIIELLSGLFDLVEITNVNRKDKSEVIYFSNLICRERFVINFQGYVINISNVPYIFRRRNYLIFLHQRYYVDKGGLSYLQGREKWSLILKRFYFKLFSSKKADWLVQTEVMFELLKRLGISSNVNPILDFEELSVKRKLNRCICIVDQVPHKRVTPFLKRVIEEMILQGIEIDAFGEILEIEGVINHGLVSNSIIIESMIESRYFFNFSTFESLGLPMIEAACAGCVILSVETDFYKPIVGNVNVIKNYEDLNHLGVMSPSVLLANRKNTLSFIEFLLTNA